MQKVRKEEAMKQNPPHEIRVINLDADHELLLGRIPERLLPADDLFDELWNLHPPEFHEIIMAGKPTKMPRWEQAYGRTYQYSGRENVALPLHPIMQPYLNWAKDEIDSRLNGMFALWYDGSVGHYIGKHRDSTIDLINGAPIVTVSLGESRKFRMRPLKGKGYQDFPIEHGSVCIIPFNTNEAWTHEVPKSSRRKGKRISLTMRAFE